MDMRDRYLGCLMGLAVGDALGTSLEFKPRGSFEEGCLLAVNLGGDADTTGSVYGQIAGGIF